MVRYPTFDRPIRIPGREDAHPTIRKAAEWVNYHHPDDIVAYPLKILNPTYNDAVDRNQPVRLGPPILGSTPISHVAYFNSRTILRPIAQRLARRATHSPAQETHAQ
jgi:hypothetical protein